MLAKFHLAEDAFALHLPLQRLERLVDIVVSNENLHEAFLFNRTRHVADIPEEVQRAIFLIKERSRFAT